jgi:hypothetical protein
MRAKNELFQCLNKPENQNATGIAYTISIICGLYSLMKMAAEIEPDYNIPDISIKKGACRVAAMWQMITFVIGFIFIIVLGIISLFS